MMLCELEIDLEEPNRSKVLMALLRSGINTVSDWQQATESDRWMIVGLTRRAAAAIEVAIKRQQTNKPTNIMCLTPLLQQAEEDACRRTSDRQASERVYRMGRAIRANTTRDLLIDEIVGKLASVDVPAGEIFRSMNLPRVPFDSLTDERLLEFYAKLVMRIYSDARSAARGNDEAPPAENMNQRTQS